MALLLPVAVMLLVSTLTGGLVVTDHSSAAPLLASIGVTAWLLGVRWYGFRGLGLRGGRPLFAGIGFATLGWVVLVLVRLVAVPTLPVAAEEGGRTFIFLLMFEAFAVQVWTFGLLFRLFADWRGGLTAAIGSGIMFGAVGMLLFQESFTGSFSGFLFFLFWGLFYGFIRLRTGSLIGMVIIQVMQSLTAWTVLVPPSPPPAAGLQTVYLVTSIAFVILIWRLWPKELEDYRV